MLWLKLGWKELINNRAFSLFFIFSLSLGLVGLLVVATFKASITQYLQANLKNILTADLVVSSRIPYTEKSLETLSAQTPENSEQAFMTTFFSMVAAPNNTALMQVTGIDQQYPLYGSFRIADESADSNAASIDASETLITERLINRPIAWMDEHARAFLNVKSGDDIQIGQQTFRVQDRVAEDTPGVVGRSGIAPKIYVGINWLPKTQLIQLGSRVNYYYLLKVPDDMDIKLLENAFNQAFNVNPDLTPFRVLSYNNANARIVDLLQYIGGFLSLVGLIALFISATGSAYLFRHYFNQRLMQMAILQSLGATFRNAYSVLIAQVLILGFLAATVSIILVAVLMPLIEQLLQQTVFETVNLTLEYPIIVMAMVVGVLSSLFFCLPVMISHRNIRPNDVFSEQLIRQPTRLNVQQLLSYAPMLLLFWGLAIVQSNWLIGSLFIGGLVLSVGLFALMAWGLFALIKRYSGQDQVIIMMAFRNIYRRRPSSLSVFLAIALGAFLLNISPQLYQGIKQEIASPKSFVLPDYFLFDIQEEQVGELTTFLQQRQVSLDYLSPNVRGRIKSVNGQPFNERLQQKQAQAESNDQTDSQTFRRRGFNLSFRESLYSSERIVEGEPIVSQYDAQSDAVIEISMDENFARRYEFKVGDTIVFDVLGVPLTTIVKNLRKVQWNSFQPNFFILVQTGVLEDAPKSFLGSISQIKDAEKATLRRELVKAFPNVSLIDVKMVVQRIIKLADQVVIAMLFMAVLSLLAGLAVIYAIARTEAHNRLWEINLLKVLGSKAGHIRTMLSIEFGLLSFTAALIGGLVSIVFTWVLSYQLFQNIWPIDALQLMGTSALITFICIFIVQMAARSVIRQKPWVLLQS